MRVAIPPSWGRRRIVGVVVLALVAALVAGAIGYNVVLRLQNYTSLEPVPAGTTVAVPSTSPVIVILFENKGEAQVIGSADAPYLNSLVPKGSVATDYQAIAHPSQPNYLALFSGSPQGVTDDNVHDVTAPTIADQLEAAGRTWRVFAENLPAGGCFTGATASGGPDGAGEYVRKHNPAISFTSISGSAERCANIQPLTSFRADAADFIWVVPNMCHSMHDCSVAEGDAWFRSFAPRILDTPAFRPGGSGVLYITFDEAPDRSRKNEIRTLVLGPQVKAGQTTQLAHSHYSLLRTIEAGLGLPCLAAACVANTMGEMFRTGD